MIKFSDFLLWKWRFSSQYLTLSRRQVSADLAIWRLWGKWTATSTF